MTPRNWIILALFCAVAPFVFVYIQFLLVPSLKLTAIKSGLALRLFMLLFGCVGAVAAASKTPSFHSRAKVRRACPNYSLNRTGAERLR